MHREGVSDVITRECESRVIWKACGETRHEDVGSIPYGKTEEEANTNVRVEKNDKRSCNLQCIAVVR